MPPRIVRRAAKLAEREQRGAVDDPIRVHVSFL
jgi:hypothetical protein